MVPTLTRPANLSEMPALDLLVIDEAHHAVADSYRRIIDRARTANPDCRIFGVTATPNRGDRKGLREIFDNVGDQVRLGELIASGHLVPPRTFIIDVGVQDELRAVRKTLSDFDMNEVAGIMNRAPVTDEVIRHWREKASDRPTVVFCSTVAHARMSPRRSTTRTSGRLSSMAIWTGDPAQDPCRLSPRARSASSSTSPCSLKAGTIRPPPASCCCGPVPTNPP